MSPLGVKALGMVSGAKAVSINTESVAVQPPMVVRVTLYQPSAVTVMEYVLSVVLQV